MKQRWIRLFHLNTREWLEENLNLFLKEYPDCEIRVWNNEHGWYAQCFYSYPEPPTYLKQDSLEDSSISED